MFNNSQSCEGNMAMVYHNLPENKPTPKTLLRRVNYCWKVRPPIIKQEATRVISSAQLL